MSDAKKPKVQTGELWVWNAPDSSAIIGLGLTPESAHADAKARRGGSGDGYATRYRLDHFPAGRNPVLPLMHARELFMLEAAALPESPPVDPPKVDEERLEGPAHLDTARKIATPKNGAKKVAEG